MLKISTGLHLHPLYAQILTWNCKVTFKGMTFSLKVNNIHCGDPCSEFQHVSELLSIRCFFPYSLTFLKADIYCNYCWTIDKHVKAKKINFVTMQKCEKDLKLEVSEHENPQAIYTLVRKKLLYDHVWSVLIHVVGSHKTNGLLCKQTSSSTSFESGKFYLSFLEACFHSCVPNSQCCLVELPQWIIRLW